MKKVLIISYSFAKNEDIGSVRIQGLYKYLPKYDWDPTVLTINYPSNLLKQKNVVGTSYEDITMHWKRYLRINQNITFKDKYRIPSLKNKKTIFDLLLSLWKDVVLYPDSNFGWYNYGFTEGNKILKSEKIDAIISSSSPATSHIIARHLKKRYNIPWVADLRDLWTKNHNYEANIIRKIFEKKLEINTLSDANALVTVSFSLAQKQKLLFPNKKIFVILNGYDPDILSCNSLPQKKFNIVYTGYLYYGKQNPEILLKVIKKLIDENFFDLRDISIDFYGVDEGWLIKCVEKYNLTNVVKINGLISRKNALKKQKEAQLLLFLTWNDPNEKGIYTGKIFEYLASGRPILSIGYIGGIIEDLLIETNSGIHVSTEENLIITLKKYYLEYKNNGFIPYHGYYSIIEKYSQIEMARSYATLLNKFIK